MAYCDGMLCVGKYCDSLKKSIKRFKFGNKPSYYRAFGKLIALKIQNTAQLGKIDIVIPVPMHKNMQKQRGYNQSALMAEYIAKHLGLKLGRNLLIKTIKTQNQSLLSKADRLTNLEGAFKVTSPGQITDSNILLVDDIITTGSTVNQCSKVLKQAGAGRIIACVIATTRVDY